MTHQQHLSNQPSKARRGRRIFGLVATAGLAATALTAPSAGAWHPDSDAVYEVTFTNTTSGQYLTPPNWAAHDRRVSVFRPGRRASEGLQAVAENGGVPVLAAELQGKVDDAGRGVSGVGAEAPIAPGESVTFTFETDERFLSAASMLICTNDGFAGLNAKRLPRRMGATRSFSLPAFDAGTEINTENRSDLVPAPFCGEGEGSGESSPELAQDGRIRHHKGIQGVGDLDASFDFGRTVASVTVERVG